MNTSDRKELRDIIREDPTIDIIIVHHADGSNDFFSHKPDVERCERMRVVKICISIANALFEDRPGRRLNPDASIGIRSDKGKKRGCPTGTVSRGPS